MKKEQTTQGKRMLGMKKGQTVLEFLFLLLIVIVYLSTLVVPMTKDSQKAITDSESVARANNEAQKLSNAIHEIALMGEGSRETINVFVPENTQILCETTNKQLKFIVTLQLAPYPAQCANPGSEGKCTKTFAANTDLNCLITTLTGASKHNIQIEKRNGQVMFERGKS